MARFIGRCCAGGMGTYLAADEETQENNEASQAAEAATAAVEDAQQEQAVEDALHVSPPFDTTATVMPRSPQWHDAINTKTMMVGGAVLLALLLLK
jgi:hypothetical protein